MLPKLHTWQWLANRAMPFELDSLRLKGYGSYQVIQFMYSHEKSNTKDWRKVMAFNRGSNVRLMGYSKKLEEALNATV